MLFLDGGETYLIQAGRVSKQMEGRGVFKRLVTWCKKTGARQGAVREVMCSNSNNKFMYTPSYRRHKREIYTVVMILVYKSKIAVGETGAKCYTGQSVTVVVLFQ